MFTIAACFRTTDAQYVYKINLATRSSPNSHCDRNTISKELQNATFILIRTHSFRGSRRVVISDRLPCANHKSESPAQRVPIQRFAVAREILPSSRVLLTRSDKQTAKHRLNVRTSMTLILTSIPLPVLNVTEFGKNGRNHFCNSVLIVRTQNVLLWVCVGISRTSDAITKFDKVGVDVRLSRCILYLTGLIRNYKFMEWQC